jgi:hypothetical protein
MPPKARPIVNTHQVYNSSNPPPKKTTPVKVAPAPVIPKIVLPDIITPPTSTTQITPTAIIPKITLPTYSGPSGTAYTSYPTIQKQPETLSASIQEDNILKKYPQLLLFIPLIIIILSKK